MFLWHLCRALPYYPLENPYSLITNTKIINESAPQNRFRVRIKVGVAYGTDAQQAESILSSIAQKNNLVAPVPEPRVRFRNFGDSSLDLELLCWAHHPEDRGRLINELNHQIYKTMSRIDLWQSRYSLTWP